MAQGVHQLLYTMPTDAGAWVDRMEAACRVLEAAFPTEDLRVATRLPPPWWQLWSRRSGGVAFAKDRHGYFEKVLGTKRRWFNLHSGDPNLGERCDRTVRFEGYAPKGTSDSVVTVAGYRGHVEGAYHLNAIFPALAWDGAERLLGELGDALGAFWSALISYESDLRLGRVQSDLGWRPAELTPLEARLPVLRHPSFGGYAPEQPTRLGWLNYWSEVTARSLGFPAPGRDEALLAHARRTAGGAWLVKLGPEPLDCAVPAHVLELVRGYERFPGIGVRVRAAAGDSPVS